MIGKCTHTVQVGRLPMGRRVVLQGSAPPEPNAHSLSVCNTVPVSSSVFEDLGYPLIFKGFVGGGDLFFVCLGFFDVVLGDRVYICHLILPRTRL